MRRLVRSDAEVNLDQPYTVMACIRMACAVMAYMAIASRLVRSAADVNLGQSFHPRARVLHCRAERGSGVRCGVILLACQQPNDSYR